MRNQGHFIAVLSALLLLLANYGYSQQTPSPEVIKKLRQLYSTIAAPEISFEKFVEINRHVYEPNAGVNPITVGNLTIGTSCSRLHTWGGNGDFESGLDQTQWLGAYGTFSGVPNPASMTDGFISGPLSSGSARQTIVTAGADPTTGISLTPPNGGARALRLGNAVNGNGTEMIAKTVTIASKEDAVLTFWYAVVFEDPSHQPQDQPAFTVRVIDCATGSEIGGVCDLGNGTNKLISNAKNPFFQSAANGTIAYRNWTRAEIVLTQHVGKKVTIQLINNDCNLGGHYGYVYLDNFGAGLSIREPGEELKDDNKIKNDVDAITNLLNNTTLDRDGVSADGVTRLLIIGQSSKSLTLSVPSDKDGLLSTLNDQNNKSTSIQVTPVMNSKGENVIIAIYTAPDGFGPQPMTKQGRPIKITVEETGNPTASKQEMPLNIFTPPVVLMHGIWSKAQVWYDDGVVGRLTAAGFSNIQAVSYLNYRTFALEAYGPGLPDGVLKLDQAYKKGCEDYRKNKIAATQVDVVAHSMGGLMTRSYIRRPDYKSFNNYKQGSIHKLITVATPHEGTPVANALWLLIQKQSWLPNGQNLPISSLLNKGGLIVSDAVRDMQDNSPALANLGVTNVKAHAITGQVGADPQTANAVLRWTRFLGALNTALVVANILGQDHDLIVGEGSQAGGLHPPFVSSYTATIHSSSFGPRAELTLTTIQNKIKELLLTDDAGVFAPAFPAPAISPAPNLELVVGNQAAASATTQLASDYIEIISPARGSSFLANRDSLTLEFKTVGNVHPSAAFFMVNGIGIFEVPQTPPYRVTFELTNPPVGKMDIVAFARDPNYVTPGDPASNTEGTLFVDTMGIYFQPVGRLIDFEVIPDSVVLDSLLQQQPMKVSAGFINGLDTFFVDLTDVQAGTRYSARKGTAIVSIDNKGVVTALGIGTDIIDVRYAGNLVSIPVRVKDTCSVPKPVITLSGKVLASSSPAGNQWFLDGLPIDQATSNTHTATASGHYTVQVTTTCISKMSDSVFVDLANTATTYYQDLDKDGYGNPNVSITDSVQPAGYVTQSGDCHDWDPAIHPGATEICNGKDDNCNGLYDETCTVYYRDEDGDGYGLWHQNIVAMTQPAGYAPVGGDCNDNDAAVHPGAIEVCNWKDDDCDGQIDESCRVFYRDADGDGYGNYAQQQYAVTAPAGYVSTGGDCNDSNANIHPGAAESCNGTDDNCNGMSDEFCVLRNYYRDADGDGYGRNDDVVFTGIQPPGYVLMNGDCHDWDASIHPFAIEVCNWKDDDCDGQIDENCTMTTARTVTAGSQSVKPAEELRAVVEFNITAQPNPSHHAFTVNLQGNYTKGKVTLKIYDNTGRLMETMSNLSIGQTIKVGAGYRPGLYVLQAEQGQTRKTIKVVKL